MKMSFYQGTTGLLANQEALNKIGQNIANVNTFGYKPENISFRNLLYSNMYVNTPNKPMNGSGVKAVSVGINAKQSGLKSTDFKADFAIAGDAWFATSHNGEIRFTRDGMFNVGLYGDRGYLVTQNGDFVLNSQGQRIELARNADGTQFDLSTLKDEIGLFVFDNPSALQPVANNQYVSTVKSGQAIAANRDQNRILQGFLENSGVSMADEMSDLILTQRAYQLCAKVIQSSDENEQIINNLRR